MAPTSDGQGYWEMSRTGAIHSYGDAHSHGSLGAGITDVIGIAATAPALPPILVPFAKSEGIWSLRSGDQRLRWSGRKHAPLRLRVR